MHYTCGPQKLVKYKKYPKLRNRRLKWAKRSLKQDVCRYRLPNGMRCNVFFSLAYGR